MKLIGVLGGTSWPSTVLLYRMLNEQVSKRLGGHHSARVLLYSIDYHAIKSCYAADWDQVPRLLQVEAQRLLSRQPDCWMLANNTPHKAYDAVAHELPTGAPFFHAVDLVRKDLENRGLEKVLLLGTRFTMEDGFFASPLEASGIAVSIPEEKDRVRIQQIQTRLAQGEQDPFFKDFFGALLAKYADLHFDAVVTACTELPLVIDQSITSLGVIDPLALQSKACVEFALSGESANEIKTVAEQWR